MSEAVVPARAASHGRRSAARVSTPALVVDLGVFDANVAAMAELLEGTGTTVRPHVKTHRTPELAKRQLGGPAVGVTCATVGEVEAMVEASIDDVLLANEIVDPRKVARLAAAARQARITVAVDAIGPLEDLSRAAVAAGVTLRVVIDVDVLVHRCGVTSVPDALALAHAIERLPGLELVGIMGFEGRVRLAVEDRAARIAGAYALLAEFASALRAGGFRVDVVTAAGTSTVPEAVADPTITEIQAGVYCLMEPELLPMGLPFRCAAVVRSSVISRHPGRVVLDAGRRVLGVEYGFPMPSGFDGRVVAVSDEHTIVDMADPVPELGGTLDLVPGQIRTTFNLHDRVWVGRGGLIETSWPVVARGRSA
jgi:D-serine deaminase-like pyridoxal phosphate-dependent protein